MTRFLQRGKWTQIWFRKQEKKSSRTLSDRLRVTHLPARTRRRRCLASPALRHSSCAVSCTNRKSQIRFKEELRGSPLKVRRHPTSLLLTLVLGWDAGHTTAKQRTRESSTVTLKGERNQPRDSAHRFHHLLSVPGSINRSWELEN